MKTLVTHPRRAGRRARNASSTFGKYFLLLCAVLMFGVQCASAQTNRERRLILNDYVSPEELISMSKSLPFDKAVSLFTDFSKKYLNKIIVDPTNDKKEIGVDIENMYWLQAFETVLRANSLWYEEKEEYFQIFNSQDSTKALASGGGGAAGAVMSRLWRSATASSPVIWATNRSCAIAGARSRSTRGVASESNLRARARSRSSR